MQTHYILKMLILSLTAGSATFIGVFIGQKICKGRGIIFGSSFAAGMMVCISLLELIPSASKTSSFFQVILFVALGALSIWLFSSAFPHIHTFNEYGTHKTRSLLRLSYLLAVGLILHDFPEGFAIPSAFQYKDSLGWLIIFASFIHNVPEGYVLTVAASGSGKKVGFFYKLALFSALSTLFGALFGVLLIGHFDSLNSIFMSLAAGAMLFISFHELIPFIKIYNQKWGIYNGFIVSILVYFLLKLFL